MTCNSCGTELPPNARFCFKCGTSSEATSPVRSPLPAPAEGDGAVAASATAVAEPPVQAMPTPASVPLPQSHTGQWAHTWSEADRRPFRYDGQWWAKTSNGDVTVWDEGRQGWAAPLLAQTPFFMRRKVSTSLQTPATWLYVLFGIFLVLTSVALVVDVTLINAANQLSGDDYLVFSDAAGENDAFDVAKGFQAVAIMGIAPFFLWWLRRATMNLPSFGVAGQGFGGGWAIGAWFIPFANLVIPVLVVNQAWRGSTPGLPLAENSEWRARPLTPLIIFWWLTYTVGNLILSGSWSIVTDEYALVSDALAAGWAGLVADCIMAPAAILAILVVVQVTRRQDAAERRFGSIMAES